MSDKPYCVGCDPNPDLGGGMGFEIYHSCERWKGKGSGKVLRELVDELNAGVAPLDRAATLIHHLRSFHKCEDHAEDELCRVMAAVNGTADTRSGFGFASDPQTGDAAGDKREGDVNG